MSDLITHTAGVSIISAIVVAIAAMPLALLVIRHNTVVNRWLVGLAYTGNILPRYRDCAGTGFLCFKLCHTDLSNTAAISLRLCDTLPPFLN